MIPATSVDVKQPSKFLIIAAFAALYIIWGSTYTAILLAIKHIPPLLMAGTRFLVAGLILYIYLRIRGEHTPPADSVRKIAVSGALMLFIGTGAVAWVEQYIPSNMAAIIIATTPLCFVLLDKREWKNNFSNKWIILGLVIGFGGVLTLVGSKGSVDFANDKMALTCFFVLIVGTIAWTSGSLYSKYKKVDASTPMKAALQMVSAGVISLLAGVIAGEHHDLVFSEITWESILGLAYLIVMGSLVAFMAYIWLLSVRSPTLVGTYAYVNPVVAMFLGWAILGETITQLQIIALAIILAGVILVTLTSKSKH